MKYSAAALAMLVATAAPALAQPAGEPSCPATPAPLPAELSPWTSKSAMKTATDFGALQPLPIGKAIDLTLLPTPDIHYAMRPGKPGGADTFGGMISFTIDRAGTYRIAAGGAPWLNVVHDGEAVDSTGHGHGPNCSGIGKMVDFKLQPGRYVLQIEGTSLKAVPLLIARLPD